MPGRSLAHLAVGQHLARLRIDNLGIEMVFPDMQAILGLDAFHRDAGADDFRQAVNIDGVHVEGLFDFLPHGVGPRLGAEHADLERTRAGVEPLGAELVENGQHVGGRDHDHVGLKILHELNLALGHAAGHRNDGAAQSLRAVMGAEAAGEQAVAIGHMHLHAGAHAGGAHRTRHH